MMDSDDVYLCHQCGKLFYKLSTLESHLKWKHTEKTNDFMCDQCGRTFQKKYNLIKHLESGIHDASETVRCAVCDFKAQNRKIMGEHYQTFHKILLNECSVSFKNQDEFFLWKSEFENKTKSRFVKLSSSRKRKNGFLRSTYFCHRDGNFISKGRNLRHLKVKGSNKINAHCPAKMDVDFGESIVIVSYIDTHLGHEMDISRINLDPSDKALIAKKLALKVPFEQILDEINSSKDDNIKRVNLLTRKDLWNIVDTFKINPKNVVYSKTRVRRKNKMLRPKKEPKRNQILYEVFNQHLDESSFENQEEHNGDEVYNGGKIIAVKEEAEENLIFCPIIMKDENNGYIQEYAVVSDENEMDAGTCLIINSEGELESVSGHRVIYSENSEVELYETATTGVEEGIYYTKHPDESVTQIMDEDECDISLLNANKINVSLMHEVAYTEGESKLEQINVNPSFERGDPNIHLNGNVSNIGKKIKQEKRIFGVHHVDELSTDENNAEMVLVKQEMDDCTEMFTSTSEIPGEDEPEYKVTNIEVEDNVNEYVIVSSTDEDQLSCSIIPAEMSVVNGTEEEVFTELVIKEEVVSTAVDEESVEFFNATGLEWKDRRKCRYISKNEEYLESFSKNILSLQSKLKTVSKIDDPENLDSEPTRREQLSSTCR